MMTPLSVGCAVALTFVTPFSAMHAAEPPQATLGATALAPAVSNENWENVSAAFTKQIGADDTSPSFSYLRRCIGLIVTPNGDIVIQTDKQGICVSRDRGATWSVVADNNIKGRCDGGWSFSLPYPYNGRMAFFCFDGAGRRMAGGMSLDDAKTWKPFAQINRGVQLGDVDWNTPDPQTIYGLTHEPYFSVLSSDGGNSWQRLDNGETGKTPEVDYCLGVIDGKTWLRGNPKNQGGIIELTVDAGQTWSQVANYQVSGRSPVHCGRNLYWTTSKGVIVSSNGKDWTLTGAGAEGALYGPYFGSTEQEFVVVTGKNFLKTGDGGKTWKPIAQFYKAPDIFHNSSHFSFFGWDPKNDILYASGLGTSVYRLKLRAAREQK